MRENKIIRKIFTLLCVLTLIVGLGILNIPVCAEEIPQNRQLPRLVDDADLLTVKSRSLTQNWTKSVKNSNVTSL